jgi:hypothetical protein
MALVPLRSGADRAVCATLGLGNQLGGFRDAVFADAHPAPAFNHDA